MDNPQTCTTRNAALRSRGEARVDRAFRNRDFYQSQASSTMTPTTERTLFLIKDLMTMGFWGTVTIRMQNGCPTHISKEESIKPENIKPNTSETANDISHK